MHWVILLLSSVLEAVWASALGASNGFREPLPIVIFVVAMALSLLGLGIAMRGISVGTAYAVWTGAGAALTVAYAMMTGSEAISPLKILFLSGLLASVAGLKLLEPSESNSKTDSEPAS